MGFQILAKIIVEPMALADADAAYVTEMIKILEEYAGFEPRPGHCHSAILLGTFSVLAQELVQNQGPQDKYKNRIPATSKRETGGMRVFHSDTLAVRALF